METEQAITGAAIVRRAKKLCAAKALMMKNFGHVLTEGSVDEILDLCERNHGLFIGPRGDTLVAFYRYWPRDFQAVYEQDFKTLGELDLARGPLLYVAAFIAPNGQGFRLLRHLVAELGVWGITAHRYDPATDRWRFVTLKNFRFKKREG